MPAARRAGRSGIVKVYVLHENPEWFEPVGTALADAGVPYEQWLLGDRAVDISEPPPAGVFWSRMSASSHTRGHPHAKDQTRGVLSWLESHGRRTVNGRRVLDLEMSKVEQHAALRAAGFDVPRTIADAGTAELPAAARKIGLPFIAKHNQGGKGLGVRLFESHDEFAGYLAGPELEPPVDGITLLQEYLRAAEPRITRAEVVGGEFIYAISADTARGGFQLCPADACAVGGGGADHGAPDHRAPDHGAAPSLFTLRDGFDHPVIGRYLAFAASRGIEIAGFEFIETADGRLVTYDINTTTNYNAQIEAAAPRRAQQAVARYLGRLLDAERALATAGKAA